MFDENFSTVNSLPTEDSLEDQWTNIFKTEYECYLDLECDEDGNLITDDIPKLDKEWLNPNKCG